MEKKRIGIMIGSDSDLRQCLAGFIYLEEMVKLGLVEVGPVITNSIHRHTEETLANLVENSQFNAPIQNLPHLVDLWIIGAGEANHITGTNDAYLRYHEKNDQIPVVGVAFEGKDADGTLAAILSITRVPGTQVIFNDYVGSDGFLAACQEAVRLLTEGPMPVIILKDAPPIQNRTLGEAIEAAKEAIRKKNEEKKS